MKQGTRTLIRTLVLVAGLFAGACASGGGRPPVVTPPEPPFVEPPVCDGRDVVIYVLNDDQAPRPMPGVRIASAGQDDRITDGNGFAHFWACTEADYVFEAAGWQTANCGGLGAACNFAGPQHRVHMTRIVAPAPPPGSHANPVIGALWSDRNGCFGDDTGCRAFSILHYGDAVGRAAAGGIDRVRTDFDRAAEAGYHVIRMWDHIRPGGWPLSGDPPSTGWDLEDPRTYRALVDVANAAAERGMRVTVETGGIDQRGTAGERRLMELGNQAAREAGPWKVAWFAPVNEPSSVHATSDDDGDVEPGHLRMLVDVARAGLETLWHLGHASNEEWGTGSRFDQARYTPADAPFGYYHASRALHWWDKIRRIFSAQYESGGKYNRKWVNGEGFGLPCSGQPLQYVSATDNCHELDAEVLALAAAMDSMRGMGGLMSGNGVRRYQEWDRVVGFREVPWAVRQLPSDAALYSWLHHSGDSHRDKRTLAAHDEVRVDGVKHVDGRFAYVIYGPHRDATVPLRIERSFDAQLCDVVVMRCEPVHGDAGGTLNLAFAKGRLFIGRDR